LIIIFFIDNIATTTKSISIIGKILMKLNGHTSTVNSLAVLPDGTLASASTDKTIKIWNTVKGIEIRTLYGHTNWSLVVLPDGTLASG
jgi:WD40 repeat protein